MKQATFLFFSLLVVWALGSQVQRPSAPEKIDLKLGADASSHIFLDGEVKVFCYEGTTINHEPMMLWTRLLLTVEGDIELYPGNSSEPFVSALEAGHKRPFVFMKLYSPSRPDWFPYAIQNSYAYISPYGKSCYSVVPASSGTKTVKVRLRTGLDPSYFLAIATFIGVLFVLGSHVLSRNVYVYYSTSTMLIAFAFVIVILVYVSRALPSSKASLAAFWFGGISMMWYVVDFLMSGLTQLMHEAWFYAVLSLLVMSSFSLVYLRGVPDARTMNVLEGAVTVSGVILLFYGLQDLRMALSAITFLFSVKFLVGLLPFAWIFGLYFGYILKMLFFPFAFVLRLVWTILSFFYYKLARGRRPFMSSKEFEEVGAKNTELQLDALRSRINRHTAELDKVRERGRLQSFLQSGISYTMEEMKAWKNANFNDMLPSQQEDISESDLEREMDAISSDDDDEDDNIQVAPQSRRPVQRELHHSTFSSPVSQPKVASPYLPSSSFSSSSSHNNNFRSTPSTGPATNTYALPKTYNTGPVSSNQSSPYSVPKPPVVHSPSALNRPVEPRQLARPQVYGSPSLAPQREQNAPAPRVPLQDQPRPAPFSQHSNRLSDASFQRSSPQPSFFHVANSPPSSSSSRPTGPSHSRQSLPVSSSSSSSKKMTRADMRALSDSEFLKLMKSNGINAPITSQTRPIIEDRLCKLLGC